MLNASLAVCIPGGPGRCHKINLKFVTFAFINCVPDCRWVFRVSPDLSFELHRLPMAYWLALACNTETLYVYFYLEMIYFVFQSEVLAGVLLLCFGGFFNYTWLIPLRCCYIQAAFHGFFKGRTLLLCPLLFTVYIGEV